MSKPSPLFPLLPHTTFHFAPKFFFTLIFVSTFSTAGYAQKSNPEVSPPGQKKEAKTRTLAAGAKVLQSKEPLNGMNMHLVGFHPMKENPEHQMEAHHFCRQVNEDFAQCALFDGSSANANLNGIEYIISEKLFNELPAEEKKYWHPHNYEILSGQLVLPGLPDVAEKEALAKKMNSYGKTWHVWNTGHHGMKGDSLPLGEPKLAWSFNRDGEALPGLVQNMEKKQKIDTKKKRENRKDLISLAKPQEGVDALNGKFKRETKAIPGVEQKK